MKLTCLHFSPSSLSYPYSPFGALSPWNDSLHYCQWQGVRCGNRHPDRYKHASAKKIRVTESTRPIPADSPDSDSDSDSDSEFQNHGLHPGAGTNRPFRSLSLIQRLNIAIDFATALDYLHNHGSSPIVHCDLKPSNVLLDEDMTAHVGDFGLARFLVQPHSMSSLLTGSTAGLGGSIGYIPPEYGMGGQASVEGDAYSYGIVVLEIFTGVSPTDERFRDGLSLHMHVEMAFSDLVTEIIDHKLFPVNDGGDSSNVTEDVHDCLVSVIRCGLLCSKLSPKERIGIEQVVKELNRARVKLLR